MFKIYIAVSAMVTIAINPSTLHLKEHYNGN